MKNKKYGKSNKTKKGRRSPKNGPTKGKCSKCGELVKELPKGGDMIIFDENVSDCCQAEIMRITTK